MNPGTAAMLGFGVIGLVLVLVVICRLLANAVRDVTAWDRRNR